MTQKAKKLPVGFISSSSVMNGIMNVCLLASSRILRCHKHNSLHPPSSMLASEISCFVSTAKRQLEKDQSWCYKEQD